MSGSINWWTPARASGAPSFMRASSATTTLDTSAKIGDAVDDWMHNSGYFVANKYGTPRNWTGSSQVSTSAAASVPSINSTASFTAGEQIGFASQAISAILGNVLANRQSKLRASALREQAGLYDVQAAIARQGVDVAMQGARMYGQQAAAAAKIGESNSSNLRLAAAQLDFFEQLRLRESVLLARQRIGRGRTGFAANGVLVDSGSAAMWEQDEAADAALERLDIMQQFEDQRWNYRTQANKALAEGYAAAAGQAGQAAQAVGQAAQAAGQAYALQLQAESARAQAARARKQTSWGATIGTVLGGAIGSVVPGVGTMAGLTAGAALGGAAGGVYDATR